MEAKNDPKKVKVKLNSKFQNIKEETDSILIVHLKSLPVGGKANDELVKLLAKEFDIPKSNIKIKSGLSARQKLIEIDIDTWFLD